METIRKYRGKLKADVASEGNWIQAGTSVVIAEVCDNFKNLSVLVTSARTAVRLPYYDTDIHWLLGSSDTFDVYADMKRTSKLRADKREANVAFLNNVRS